MVRDTGIGIAEDALLRRMGGSITLQSQLGHGSTFAVTLPLMASTDTDSASGCDAPDLTGQAIMLVAPQTIEASLIARRLQRWGAQTCTVSDLASQCNAMAQKLAEQQERLTRVNEELEQTVRERTRQLEESSERLRAIDASRRLFFSKISHELRTPVTVLMGEAEVARQQRQLAIHQRIAALPYCSGD
eukprot:gene41653-56377_t